MGLCLTNGFPLEFYQSLLNLRRNCKRLNIQCSVFEQDALVLPLKMGDFRIVHGPNVVYVPFDLQRCDIFLNSSAGISVWYKNFSGIYSANCCNTSRIVVKSKMAV